MNHIKGVAESWATAMTGPKGSKAWTVAHDSFLLGWSASKMQAVQCLKRQYEGCQPGTLVSYAIAADVLNLDMKEYEEKGWPEKKVAAHEGSIK